MGAHTLGNAHGNISGYNGVWVEGEMTQFDNKYYQLLVDTSLTFTNTVSRVKVYNSVLNFYLYYPPNNC